MLYKDALIVDYGPRFFGHSFLIDGEIVCLVPRQQSERGALAMRETVRDLGGDCGECRNCPWGKNG